jgi:hypothetical protein
MKHTPISYKDLDFVIEEMAEPKDIAKAFLYTNDIKDSGQIINCLNSQVDPKYRDCGVVRRYNAGMSREY